MKTVLVRAEIAAPRGEDLAGGGIAHDEPTRALHRQVRRVAGRLRRRTRFIKPEGHAARQE